MQLFPPPAQQVNTEESWMIYRRLFYRAKLSAGLPHKGWPTGHWFSTGYWKNIERKIGKTDWKIGGPWKEERKTYDWTETKTEDLWQYLSSTWNAPTLLETNLYEKPLSTRVNPYSIYPSALVQWPIMIAPPRSHVHYLLWFISLSLSLIQVPPVLHFLMDKISLTVLIDIVSCAQTRASRNQKKLTVLPWYCELFIGKYIELWVKGAADWAIVRLVLRKEYKDDDFDQLMNSWKFLDALKSLTRLKDDDLVQYCQLFAEISKGLIPERKLDLCT